jgi:hypothetical protein
MDLQQTHYCGQDTISPGFPGEQNRGSAGFAVGELIGIFGGDVGGDAAEEAEQAGRAGIAEVAIGVEDVFESFQEGIVVEGCVGDAAWFQKRRKQYGTGTVAAIALEVERKVENCR